MIYAKIYRDKKNLPTNIQFSGKSELIFKNFFNEIKILFGFDALKFKDFFLQKDAIENFLKKFDDREMIDRFIFTFLANNEFIPIPENFFYKN